MIKTLKILFAVAILFLLEINYCLAQTFTNSTATTCGNDFGSTYPSLQPQTIVTSGLPAGGLSTAGTTLQQINIKLGNKASCNGSLATYSLALVNPAKTQTLTIANGLLSSTNTFNYVNVHYRDNNALERLRDYAVSTQNAYLPHSIGYYRVETAGTFSIFNDGTNPNGNWTLHIIENTSSEVDFERVDLIFGPQIFVYDYAASGSTANNDCSSAYCFDLTGVVVGTNNGYTSTDPNYPGNTTNGCSWNGANNNSAWFEFQASATTAYISLSGIDKTGSTGDGDTQPIIVQAPSPCAVPTIVPTGGCPDDQTQNNLSYITTNGGSSSAANVYVNGISDNTEFNLSGLTVGQNYYLYIDGDGGASSTFYIEGLSGLANCVTVLPVTWLNVQANCSNYGNTIKWTVSNQINNKCFEILKSTDGTNFYMIGSVKGDINYQNAKAFEFEDSENNISFVTYYKIRQIDLNGRYTESSITSCQIGKTQSVTIGSNPFSSWLNIIDANGSIVEVQVYDAIGRKITEVYNTENNKTWAIDSYNWQEGVYFIHVLNKDSDVPLIIKAVKTN